MSFWKDRLSGIWPLPLVRSMGEYSGRDLRKDLVAGLTVGIVVVPQGLAYAMLVNLPPVYGLYASLVPTVLYAIFGTSRLMSVGPVAMSSLLVLAGVGALAEPGSDKYIMLAIATGLYVGIAQLVFGVFKLGFLINFLSVPVIKGFTAAAAVIIGASQLSHLLGITLPRSNHLDEVLVGIFSQISSVHILTFLMGLGAILVITLVRLIHKAIPGSLLVVIIGVVLVSMFHLDQQGVHVVGNVPRGLPGFIIPHASFSDARGLVSLVFLLTFISMIESIAIAKAVQGHSKYRIDPDQELVALGISKIVGAFFQSYPTTGSFSRSAVNAKAGAKTGIASIASAAVVAMTLLFLTPVFTLVPTAVLAAIILTAVAGFIDVKTGVRLWKIHRSDFYMMIATFFATIYLGILQGVVAGVILSLVLMIYRSTKPHINMLGRIPGTVHFRNIDRFPEAEESDNTLIVRFDAPLFFGNANYFLETIEQFIDEGKGLKYFILDASTINDMDSSGADALEEVIEAIRSRQIRFLLSGAIGSLRDRLFRSGLMQKIGTENQFLDVNDAILAIDGDLEHMDHALQTNLGKTT